MSTYTIGRDETDPRVIVRFNRMSAAVIEVERLAVDINIATGTVTVYDATEREALSSNKSVICSDVSLKQVLQYLMGSLESSEMLMFECAKHMSKSDKRERMSFSFPGGKYGGIILEMNVQAAEQIYEHLKQQFEQIVVQIEQEEQLENEPSDFVCMKMVTRLRELRRADPSKARTGIIDISWMREILIAAKSAELIEQQQRTTNQIEETRSSSC